MKNLILSALLAVTVATTAFATGESNISYFVLNSFRHDFKDVTNVAWTSKTDFAKATFIQNNRKMEVYYNPNGDLIAISKNIQLDELPVNAKRAFAKRYEGYTVKEAIQFDGTDEQGYYLSAENEQESVIIKIDQNEQLSLFRKSKK
ncbi:MAG: hypothetical protein JWQ09_834 [Segetibacter sp.]|nr:hypothetical protein [Segetibacter sp.]